MTTTPAMPELPDGATVLPDGSAFAIASFPLPSDHWLYAHREYRDGEEEPIELPSPILSHQAHGDIVRAAIRYAVRSATMCGKEPDFDPDALVQNAMYALCGPFGGATLQAQPAAVAVSDEDIWRLWDSQDSPELSGGPCPVKFARAILALHPQAVPMPDEVKDQALDLLATMFDAYENGVPCHEDNGGGYIGMAFSLDNETFHACADILNAHRPKAHHGITAPAGGEVK